VPMGILQSAETSNQHLEKPTHRRNGTICYTPPDRQTGMNMFCAFQ